jgi:hypothetical protein
MRIARILFPDAVEAAACLAVAMKAGVGCESIARGTRATRDQQEFRDNHEQRSPTAVFV